MTSSSIFEQELDEILQNPSAAPWEKYQGGARQDLLLAHRLARIDLSSQSRVRITLRAELLNALQPKTQPLAGLSRLVQPRVVFWLIVITAMLFLVGTPVGASLAQSGAEIIERWLLGANSQVLVVEGDFEQVPGEDGRPVIQTPGTEGKLPVPESYDTVILAAHPDQFDAAQRLTEFKIGLPQDIPEGFIFSSVSVFSSQRVELLYMGKGHQGFISILQTAVGADGADVSVAASSDIQVTELDLDGTSALWLDAGNDVILVFEMNGVNYQVMGAPSLEDALVLARSIE